MIEITYKWRQRNDILIRRIIGLGYHKGNTNFGQVDFMSIIDEESDINTGAAVWATCLFCSGDWIRKLQYKWQSLKFLKS